jgi:uncharacterized protein (DUF362 family)/Pyruvate/2-oxoacid:ferredoxin oxidoreductase delta subunit
MSAKVAIERCKTYDPDELYAALKKTALSADFPDVTGKTVLLKPNIVMDSAPAKAVTTHPVFLEAVILLAREFGASRILVGDSPGLPGPNFAARGCGIGEATKKCGAEWVDFTKGTMELACPEGKAQKSFAVSKVLQDVDLIINLPKLKNHQLMYYTGAMKNLFGLVPSIKKSSYHVRYPSRESFASMIVDLNTAVKKPVYALMDAVVAMEGPGPSAGTPKQVGLILASANLLAMDVAASSIVGYPPQLIPVNKEALARKIWLNNFSEIEYPLLKPQEVMVRDFIKIPFKKTGSQLLDFITPRPLKKLFASKNPLPVIDGNACVCCSDCVKICASNAIKLTNQDGIMRIVIDNERCIRCYCCHEICSEKAIKV